MAIGSKVLSYHVEAKKIHINLSFIIGKPWNHSMFLNKFQIELT